MRVFPENDERGSMLVILRGFGYVNDISGQKLINILK